MTFRQLVVFDAIARAGSVSEAAESISLTQSAASMSLRDLERNLGIALFHRKGRRLVLTEQGKRYRPVVHDLLQQARELESLHLEPELRGELRVGASITIGNYVLPSFCGRFMREHPGVHIELVIAESPEIARKLEALDLDLAFIENPLDRPAVQSRPWIRDEMFLFCAPTHPLAGRRKVRIDELRDCVWIVGKTRTTINAALSAHAGTLRIGLQTTGLEAMKRAVIAGNGIGCLSRFALESDMKLGLLSRLRVSGLDITRTFRVMTLRGARLGRIPRAFLDSVLTAEA